ncbi:MAG TPA: FdhF/YdeP family oxidoreductase [Myxococcales bacterium]|nr:FdhF/YdeP family oxidoreductase [Myxococcales bacterium]
MKTLRKLWNWIRLYFPFGLLYPGKPRHYREMFQVAWDNRGSWGYAWRILRHGVCDGCSLGPRGLRDDVIAGVHLCLTRLSLLRFNTMRAIGPGRLTDTNGLTKLDGRGLQRLGRLDHPYLRRRGEKGFTQISWDEAEGLAAAALREVAPDRMGFFATSRGLGNEAYYAFQKLARVVGTNNVDSCARLCHAASVAGLRDTLGIGAPTISLSDLIGSDLVILFGTNLPNNQPVSTKYLHFARKAGTRFLVVNPAREPMLDRYWVPSVARSALFGTKLCDDFFQVRVGGDIAFIHGVLKELLLRGALDEEFVAKHTEGLEALRSQIAALPWEALEQASGLPRREMARFADWYARAKTAVIVYSMGLTQHRFGVENVKAIVNLALCRGMIGRSKCGILPIRGHSGVQGTSEVGVDPDKYCTGDPVGVSGAARLAELWEWQVPTEKGLRAAHVMEAAGEGRIDCLYSIGGNYLETLPDPAYVRTALGKIRYRIHQDIVLNAQQLVEPGEWLLLLPAATRYETPGGITSTSTERRIRFSPEIAGPRVGEALPEWEIPARLGRRAYPDSPHLFNWSTTDALRAEMERCVPLYQGISGLKAEGQWVQWGGARLCADGRFKTPSGRARFSTIEIPPREAPEGRFQLATRRGKQFNSIVLKEADASMGNAGRQAVFFAVADMDRLSLRAGDPVRLRSEVGAFTGIAHVGPVREGTLQAYWPECNQLLVRRYDPVSSEPDYNAWVAVERAGSEGDRSSAA